MGSGGAFREVPYMGVIWVVAEAHKSGFWNGNPDTVSYTHLTLPTKCSV